MKKSIFATFGFVVVLALLVGDRFLTGNTVEDNRNQPYEVAENNEENTGLIVIEEEQVPLAATVPNNGVEIVATEAKEPEPAKAESPEKAAEPVCLTDGNHNNVWTDNGDYKVMKCTSCGQETGKKACNLGNGIYGYYDDTAAAALFTGVNDGRSAALSGGLDDIAKSRALSCVKNFSHDGMQTASECIAQGQYSAEAVIASWNASDYHRGFITSETYTQGGSACLWYDTGNGAMQSVWVLVLNE